MPINVKIQNKIPKIPCNFDVKKTISNALEFCEPEHLIGLEKIVVVDNFTGIRKRAEGYYSQKYGRNKASIHISFRNVYRGAPKWFFCLHFMPSISLKHVLYHEIGHHYHSTLSHGVTKLNRELFAEQYRRKMMRRSSPKWMYLFVPLKFIVMLLKGISKKDV